MSIFVCACVCVCVFFVVINMCIFSANLDDRIYILDAVDHMLDDLLGGQHLVGVIVGVVRLLAPLGQLDLHDEIHRIVAARLVARVDVVVRLLLRVHFAAGGFHARDLRHHEVVVHDVDDQTVRLARLVFLIPNKGENRARTVLSTTATADTGVLELCVVNVCVPTSMRRYPVHRIRAPYV